MLFVLTEAGPRSSSRVAALRRSLAIAARVPSANRMLRAAHTRRPYTCSCVPVERSDARRPAPVGGC